MNSGFVIHLQYGFGLAPWGGFAFLSVQRRAQARVLGARGAGLLDGPAAGQLYVLPI